jgi:acylphosphatase
MKEKKARAEIIATGVVQGVGFRYFVVRNALALGLTGYTKNLFTGEVLTVAEGERFAIEALIEKIKIGPSRAYVKNVQVAWLEYKGEFKTFEVKY